MKNRTTKNEFWYYRIGSGKQTDGYWERRVLVVLRDQSDTVVTEIHFWILFLSCWLGTAPCAPFYVNSWERITELGEQGERGKKANMRKQ